MNPTRRTLLALVATATLVVGCSSEEEPLRVPTDTVGTLGGRTFPDDGLDDPAVDESEDDDTTEGDATAPEE